MEVGTYFLIDDPRGVTSARQSTDTIGIEEGVLRMTKMGNVVRFLKLEHARLTKQIEGVSAALAAFGESYTGRRGAQKTGAGGRTISAAGRARIAAAQRARWAKAKAQGTQDSAPKTRTMSAAGRKRIAAAQRARWAKIKAKNS
jgi:hypothetical protein